MNKSSLVLGGLIALVGSQVWAVDPPAQPAAVAPAAAAGTQTAPSAASPGNDKPAAAGDAAKAAADAEAAAKAQDKRFIAMGYKPTKRDGVTVYCRKEEVLGSRFTRMNCSTAETLQRTADNAQAETDRMVRRSLNQVPSN